MSRIIAFLLIVAGAGGCCAAQARAYLVESIPVGMEDLRCTEGVRYTEDVLKDLVDGATKTIDLTAMYWNLLPAKDSEGFDEKELAKFGAGHGRALLDALQRAASRGVRIRILDAKPEPRPGEAPPGPSESDDLKRDYADVVRILRVDMQGWYGGGIMHQKIWVFDRKNAYLGSANMDWKSISQVKEMGVAVEDHAELAEDLTNYFEGWWKFAGLPVEPAPAAWDPQASIKRPVPKWSALLPEPEPSPLARWRTSYNWASPLRTRLNGQAARVFITGCPRELCAPERTYDGDGLVKTILDAKKSVSISVMDFAPTSLYRRDEKTGVSTPVWWPALIDAIQTAVLAHGVHVRLLVSQWAHTSPVIRPYLEALAKTADAAHANPNSAAGRLEIRLFIAPGWDQTSGKDRKFPGHTRVNHTKYIVTDRRLNIGTSNMTWSYFACTAGGSFNTDHRGLVDKLQEVFDRDWGSRYAHPLDAVR